jgi:hypothetical protein
VKKILIASTARSGTGFISALLKNCGLNVGHEQWAGISECIRKPYGVWNLPPNDGESSWLMVPLLHMHPHLLHNRDRVVLLHQVRDPFVTLRSWMRLGKLRQYHMYDQWVYDRNPIRPGNHASQLVRHWMQWHEMIEDLGPDLTYRVEDMDERLLERILQLAEVPRSRVSGGAVDLAIHETSKKTNSRGQADFHAEDVNPELWDAFVLTAMSYGYEAPPGYTGRKEPMPRVLNPHQARDVMCNLTEAVQVLAAKVYEGIEPDARVLVALDCAMETLGMKDEVEPPIEDDENLDEFEPDEEPTATSEQGYAEINVNDEVAFVYPDGKVGLVRVTAVHGPTRFLFPAPPGAAPSINCLDAEGTEWPSVVYHNSQPAAANCWMFPDEVVPEKPAAPADPNEPDAPTGVETVDND